MSRQGEPVILSNILIAVNYYEICNHLFSLALKGISHDARQKHGDLGIPC